mgnify:FL=1
MHATALLLAALLRPPAGPYAPCAHTPDEPGPTTTRAAQLEVGAAIRREVERLGGSPMFARYLIHVAARESSLRPGVIHRKDAELAAAAYRRLRGRHRAAGNPWANRPEAWLSYGLFGMNSNYWAGEVDPKADPRRLCELTYAVQTYAAAARSRLPRIRSCGVAVPRWGDIHRAIQGGSVCPDGGAERIPAWLAAEPVRPGDLGAVSARG